MTDTCFDRMASDELIEKYYPQMEKELCRLLSLSSVDGLPQSGAPFGKDIALALAHCLDLGKQLGFSTTNVDGYCGCIDLPGLSEEQIGILVHVDVVPANAADWQHPPFEPQIDNGNIYGRGAVDNKGPLIASLFAMKALAALDLQLTKTVRLIIGCNEEKGFACLKYYLQHHQQPGCGFSPDAGFPAICGEKGIIHWDFCDHWPEDKSTGLQLVDVQGGQADNIIPAKAAARFAADEMTRRTLLERIENSAEKENLTLTEENDTIIISALGKAGHGSMPESGENAIAMLLKALQGLDIVPKGAAGFIDKLSHMYADPASGRTLGIDGSDKFSKLTAVPTILTIENNSGRITTDCRFPITHQLSAYQQKLADIAAEMGFTIENSEGKEPSYNDPNSDIVTKLIDVYRQRTGDMTEPLVIGGGTYARMMKNFIAFGPEFPGTERNIHQNDEFMPCLELKKLAEIYAAAIYALAK